MQYQNTDLDVDQNSGGEGGEESNKVGSSQSKQEDTSLEVEQLKKLFQELLDTRRFEINDFLQKNDSEAIMDLAQAASIFKKSKNYKALGICYNNIANIQYKNAQYNEAATNFTKALSAVEKLMEDLILMMKSIDHESSKAAKGMAAMYDRDIHLKRESYSTELEYFEKIRAHRVYQYAMSRYKLMRYSPQNVKDPRMNWQLVDYELRQALERYNEIRVEVEGGVPGKKQPLFIDMIIKITVCRAYANLNNKKILTAEKILESTRCLINFVEKGRI